MFHIIVYKQTSETVFSNTPIGATGSRSEAIEEIRTMNSEFNASDMHYL